MKVSATAFVHFQQTLAAWGDGNTPQALQHAQSATAAQPENIVFREAAIYLQRVQSQGKHNVYVTPEGFSAFIRGGGNVGLYAITSELLRAVYQSYASLSLLDIGVGDGLALLPAITDSTHIHQIDLIEPSAAMLPKVQTALQARGIHHRAFNGTLQQAIAQHAFGAKAGWDVAEATYSLQAIAPAERPGLLTWLGRHTQRMLVAEFDAPHFADTFDALRVRYFLERYTKGLAEYEGAEGEVVRQGFLMPIFFGGFDTTAARTNWEMPIADWIELLKDAGFTRIERHKIFAYWWADAYLIDAS